MRISPPVVVLRPPEKLVLEVQVDGTYTFIDWMKDGKGGFTLFDESFIISENNIAHFQQVYTNSPTTSEYDIGLYTISVVTQNSRMEKSISVIQFGKFNMLSALSGGRHWLVQQ